MWAASITLIIITLSVVKSFSEYRVFNFSEWKLVAPTGKTISGLSSGAFQAVQFHVAHSSIISAVGVIAGGPYWCAEDDVDLALALMTNPSLIIIDDLIAATSYAATLASIDPPLYMKGDKVWLFSGTDDTVVNPGVVQKVSDYYSYYGTSITSVFTIPAEHAIVTNDYGNTCNQLSSPYVNNCNYDSVGKMWSTFFGTLAAAVTPISSNLFSYKQGPYIPPPFTPDQVGMSTTGYVYIPNNCKALRNQTLDSTTLACAVHIALHGCNQNYETVGDAFVAHGGYNKWAESNNVIVLYPQAAANALNPQGCWDWWGYTGTDYATKFGYQIATIKNILDAYS